MKIKNILITLSFLLISIISYSQELSDEERKLYNLVHFKIFAVKNIYLITGLKAHGIKAFTFEAGLGVKI